MVMSAEYRSKFPAFTGMVTSPYERKIHEWDKKKNPKANKKKQIQIQFT